MNSPDCYPCGTPRRASESSRRAPGLWLALAGTLSLAWLLLRSGGKPARLSYPCQSMASQVVGLAFGAAAFRWLRPRLGAPARWSRLVLGLASCAIAFACFSDQPPSMAKGTAPAEYRAQLYVVHDAGGPDGEHHDGFDSLVSCMDAGGLPLYASDQIGPAAGPNGVVGAHDVVLVKVNQQWSERGGTNTDLLKGLIARLLEHPDGFDGEIVVIENTQNYGSLDWDESNAEDHSQSALDVIQHFSSQGKPVSGYLLDTIRTRSVAEYSSGDLQDGYVVGPLDSGTQIRVSYPKFRTAGGRYVSLKHGVWDPGAGVYSDAHFTFLNVPVFKCHGAVYGVTGATKNHMGTMTTALATGAHNGVRWGGLGRFLADVRMPDLNILDCIYILAQPSTGPACSYENATRVDKLVAGTDPIAIDLWSTTNILVPTIIANGYTTWPKQDPTNPASIFRLYLDNAMGVLLAAGRTVTNDLAKIDVFQLDATGVPDAWEAGFARAVPNPSDDLTRITFTLRAGGAVHLTIYDATGRSLRVIEQSHPAGPLQEIVWDGRDDAGRRVPRGMYRYRIESPEGNQVGSAIRL